MQTTANATRSLYFQSFATTQHPHGIFICPTIDIILLEKPCSSYPTHECDDCTNFELGLRLQRYNKTGLAQTIAFHGSKLLGIEIEGEAYKNMCYIHNTFRAIKNIVVRVNYDLDDFRHIRGGIEDQIQDLSQLVRVNGPSHEQSLDFIRVTAINYMDDLLDWDWKATPDVVYLNQREIDQQIQNHIQWDWEEAMDFYFPDLPPEDRSRRWQSFIELSAEGQREHLQRFVGWNQ